MTLARKPWLEFGVSYVQPIDNKRLVSCVEGRRIVAALPPSAPGMALDRQEPKAFLFPPALRDPILASLDQPPPASEDRQAQADQERVLARSLFSPSRRDRSAIWKSRRLSSWKSPSASRRRPTRLTTSRPTSCSSRL